MKRLLTLFCCCLPFIAAAQTKPELRYADKIRTREAMNIAARYGDRLFEGFSKVPFAIVLVSDSIDFLINHPDPSPDFISLGRDELLQTTIYYRRSVFDPHLLATFPAVNGLSCIVVGTPENTHKNSSEWVITLLHEHFHQYQNSAPDYYSSVNALDLSNGDQTGMWMLNYPFPYDSLPVKAQFASFTKALQQVIKENAGSKTGPAFSSALEKYYAERKKFRELLKEKDYRYFSFQVWQEGLARHTEYRFLELLAGYEPSKEMRSLPGFESFAALKTKMFHTETNNLLSNQLDMDKRICFYAVGFGEGLLLDRVNSSWRKKYLADKFFVENYMLPQNAVEK